MTDEQKEKQKQNLVKQNLMAESDTLVDYLQAARYEKLLGFLGSWSQGWIYFTDKAIVYPLLLGKSIVIPYKSITGVSPCTQFFMPMGIAVSYTDAEGKPAEQRFSMMKRDGWISFIEEKRKA